MRHGVSLVLFVLLLSPISLSQSKPDFLAKGEVAENLATILDQMADRGFRGAVLAARDGKVLIARGRGDENIDATTLFEIASTTKQFTAAAILRLQEKRKLKLDDPIKNHLPGVPKNCAKITIRHLLHNTSGIPRENAGARGVNLEEAVSVLLKGGPKHEPGTHFEYWNFGWALLSGIVDKKSGSNYMDFCKKELFKKAKMKTACFTGDKAPRKTKVAVGKGAKGDRSALDHPYVSYGYQYRGMGGAVCTVWDMWHWDRALANGKALKEASMKELFEPGLENYALGWRVEQRGDRLVQHHDGDVDGFHTAFRRYPEGDACLVLFIATEGQNRELYVEALESALFGGSTRLLSRESASPFVGTYRSGDGVKLELLVERHELIAKFYPPGSSRPSRLRGMAGEKPGDVVFVSGSRDYPTKVNKRDPKTKRVVRFVMGGRTFERVD